MCGLFGIFPFDGITKKQKADLRNLFLWLGGMNDDRGGHSYGIWGRDHEVTKGTGYFVNSIHQLKKVVSKWDVKSCSWMAGHTRFATHGAKTQANAHPFAYNNLILAHNGVLTVHAEVTGKVPEVDSNHLAKYLSENLSFYPDSAWEDVFAAAIKNVTGSIGLLMSDEAGNLRAYASMQELHYACGDWGYAISSSKHHLENALEAAGVPFNTLMAIADDMLVAPWYQGAAETYAPSMGYSVKGGKSSAWGSGWDWKDYDYREFGKVSDITRLDDYYSSTGSSVPGIVKSAEESAQVFAEDFPKDSELGEEDPIANSLCELCSSRTVGPNPDTWTDPDSGHTWLICPDCSAMFHNEDFMGVNAPLNDVLDMSQIEAMMDLTEA